MYKLPYAIRCHNSNCKFLKIHSSQKVNPLSLYRSHANENIERPHSCDYQSFIRYISESLRLNLRLVRLLQTDATQQESGDGI
jgi:hypothetical protein